MNNVAILLSSYNGEKYIFELLDSLANQSYKKFDLIIRDDGSSDKTREIVSLYKSKNTISIIVLENDENQEVAELSLSSSFFKLVKFANNYEKYEFFMFCDQDDIWHENKIETMVDVISKEAALRVGQPILAHSDLDLINEKGDSLYSSFWEWQNINPYRNSTSRLLIQNTVTGCATIMNRELSMMLEEGPNLYYHDHRAALIASLQGAVIPISESLIDYRQHGKNVSGAGGVDLGFFKKTIYIISLFTKIFFNFRYTKKLIIRHYDELKKILNHGIEEAIQLNELYEKNMSNESKESVTKLSKFYELPNYSRILILIRGNFLPNSFYRSLGLLFVSLFQKDNNSFN